MPAMDQIASHGSQRRLRSSSPQHSVDTSNRSPTRLIQQRSQFGVLPGAIDLQREVAPSTRALPLAMLEPEIKRECGHTASEAGLRQRLSSSRKRQFENQVDEDDSDSDSDTMMGRRSGGANQERWKTRLLNKKLRNRTLGMRRYGGPPVDLMSCHKLSRDSDNESSSTTASGTSTESSGNSKKNVRSVDDLQDDLDVRLSLRSKVVVALSVLYGVGLYSTFLTGTGIFTGN